MKSSVELIMLAAGPGIDLSGVPLLIRRQPWKQLQAAIDVDRVPGRGVRVVSLSSVGLVLS